MAVLYPNPAKGDRVRLAMPQLKAAGDVRVLVYTTGYRKTRDLVVPNVQPGMDISLELLDDWGNRLSNGLYFVKVVLPDGDKPIVKLLVTR